MITQVAGGDYTVVDYMMDVLWASKIVTGAKESLGLPLDKRNEQELTKCILKMRYPGEGKNG